MTFSEFVRLVVYGSSPALPNKLKLEGQQVFAGFLAYNWSKQSISEIRKYVETCSKSGFTGITFELIELLTDWPRANPATDMFKQMEQQVISIGPWITECRRCGMWARIIINNSNADLNKNLKSAASMTNAVTLLKKKYGEDNILILPVSEEDSDLRAEYRKQIIDHCESLYSRNHTIAFGNRRPDALWYENHLRDPAIPLKGTWQYIAVSDTGEILRKLHEDGVMGQKPITKVWDTFVRSNLQSGVSVCCYAFHTKPNYELLSALGKTIKANIR